MRSYKYPWPIEDIPPDKDWQIKRALWICQLEDRFDENYFNFTGELNRLIAINPEITLAWLDAKWTGKTWYYPYLETKP